MSTLGVTYMELAEKLHELVRDQAEWSQATFGTDEIRGPFGALRHLELEAREAWDAAMKVKAAQVNPGESGNLPAAKSALKVELADCFLLLLDASRRAGVKPMQLIEAAQEKMKVNRARTWPVPADDGPIEHLKEGA